MANTKKYYWIKLKTDFFSQKEVKKLRKIAGGDTYTIIYLKLQLLSAKTDGIIKYDKTEKDLIEQLELELDENRENIKITLAFLDANRLIEKLSDTDYLICKACDSIGKEGTSAERVRKHRSKQISLQCNTIETSCNTEKEKEKELKIEKDIKVKPTIRKSLTVQKNPLIEKHPLKENIKEFIEHRKQIKKPMSDLALSKFINKIDDFGSKGFDVRKCIDDAIEASYQTIYEPKPQHKQFTSKQQQQDKHTKAVIASVGRWNTNQVNISEDPFVADFDPLESFYE